MFANDKNEYPDPYPSVRNEIVKQKMIEFEGLGKVPEY